MGVCAIGIYDQEAVDNLLQLDGKEELIIYLAAVGKKDSNRSIMLFTLLGDAYVGDELIEEKTAVKLTSGDHVKIMATDKNAQVLFISSNLLNEPVVWGGPIVMNTKAELNKAFDDLQKGTFLQKIFHTKSKECEGTIQVS